MLYCRFCADTYEARTSKLASREPGLCPPCARMDIIEKHVHNQSAETRVLLAQQSREFASLMSTVTQIAAAVSRLQRQDGTIH